jgi:Fe-S cluster assembly protein SufD
MSSTTAVTAAALDRWQEAHELRLQDESAPAWLPERRREAIRAFRETGFPTSRDEAWRYTDLGSLTRTPWTVAPEPDGPTLARAQALLEATEEPVGTSARIVLVNGHVAPSLSTGLDASGLEIGTLESGVLQGGEDPLLLSLVPPADHPFAAINSALFSDAVLVRIPSHAAPAGPLHLVGLSIGGPEAQVAHPRILIHAGAHSRSAVVVTWRGDAASAFLSNAVGEVRLEEGARLDMLDVQRQPASLHHVWNLGVHIERDAAFATCCVQLGAKVARSDLGARLNAEGAACRLDGVTFLGRRQHVDVRTHMDHAMPHGQSHQLWKSVLEDHARTAFAGTVLVRPGAQKTDAKQANHNLLLSPDAVSDSVPMLEIFADDVKCAHGATVGQLDPDALFFLRSRGIGVDDAKRMLVRAFVDEVPGRIEDEALAEHARLVLASHLGQS